MTWFQQQYPNASIVDAQPLDKAAILKERNVFITNPQPYELEDRYAGQFLIIGEILNE